MIEFHLTGDGEMVARLHRFNQRLQPEMKTGMERLTVKLQTLVRGKLSGPVLKVRTGRLRNSVARDVFQEGLMVTGMVSTPVSYAKPHEYGFHGTVQVKEHMRTVRQAFGRSIEPTEALVSAHSMRMNLPERSFLRSSLREMDSAGTIVAEMEAAVSRAAVE